MTLIRFTAAVGYRAPPTTRAIAMSAQQNIRCPVCNTPNSEVQEDGENGILAVSCPNCGPFKLSSLAPQVIDAIRNEPKKVATLAHVVRLAQSDAVLTGAFIAEVLEKSSLPPALERLDLLVVWMALNVDPGTRFNVIPYHWRARLGCVDEQQVKWVLIQAEANGWLDRYGELWSLTARGWIRYQELVRDGHGSRYAFMAMDFNYPDQTAFVERFLMPAVAETGFELRTTNHPQKTAGLIDNRMRVEIRTSRFVVVDLTHGNRGAYWEAGFAEGLGRPVIYVCQADVLRSTDPATKLHFDINHQLILTWQPDDPAPFLQEIKDLIRATLPHEARMGD